MRTVSIALAVAALAGITLHDSAAAEGVPRSDECLGVYPPPPACLQGKQERKSDVGEKDRAFQSPAHVSVLDHLALEAEVTDFRYDPRRLEARVDLMLRNRTARYQAVWLRHVSRAVGEHVALTTVSGDSAVLVPEQSTVKLCRSNGRCSDDWIRLDPNGSVLVSLLFDAARTDASRGFRLSIPLDAAIVTDAEAAKRYLRVRRDKARPGMLTFTGLGGEES